MRPVKQSKAKNACIVVNTPGDAPQKTVVILGVQRGGTSMCAAVVHALGVDLGAEGINHEDPRFLGANAGELESLIAERNAEKDVWGFKAPSATLKISELGAKLRNPHYICVTRNIFAAVDAVMMRRGGDPRVLLKRVLNFYNKIADLAAETPDPVLLVNYERASTNPAEFVDAVARFLGIEPTDEVRARAESVVTGDGGGYLRPVATD